MIDQPQRNHISDIRKLFYELVEKKYIKGAEEHGGYIWDQSLLQLIDNAMEETVDQFVFLQTLREKAEAMRDNLAAAAKVLRSE